MPARDWYAEGFRLVEAQYVKLGAEVALSYVETEYVEVIGAIMVNAERTHVTLNGHGFMLGHKLWVRQEW